METILIALVSVGIVKKTAITAGTFEGLHLKKDPSLTISLGSPQAAIHVEDCSS